MTIKNNYQNMLKIPNTGKNQISFKGSDLTESHKEKKHSDLTKTGCEGSGVLSFPSISLFV